MATTPLEIHISDVRSFKDCRVRWHFSSILRLNLEFQVPNRHLWLGSGIHYGLAAYYGSPSRAPEALINAYRAWAKREFKRLRQLPYMQQENWEEIRESFVLGQGVLRHFLEWSPTVDRFDVIMPEVQFRIPVSGRWPWLQEIVDVPVYFCGTADGLVKAEDGYWLMEHKSAASLMKEWSSLFMDEQNAAYTWASHIDPRFEGMRPKGTMYTFLRKKIPTTPKKLKTGGLSKNKTIDTTYERYLAAIKANNEPTTLYGEILAVLRRRPNDFFKRTYIVRQPLALSTFEGHLRSTVFEMLNPNTPIYPNPGVLAWKCRSCAFRTPCKLFLNGFDTGPILRANYKERTPRPIEWANGGEEK